MTYKEVLKKKAQIGTATFNTLQQADFNTPFYKLFGTRYNKSPLQSFSHQALQPFLKGLQSIKLPWK